MTKDELLEAIDEEIERQRALRYRLADLGHYTRISGRIAGLNWVRDLIEEPPGSP